MGRGRGSEWRGALLAGVALATVAGWDQRGFGPARAAAQTAPSQRWTFAIGPRPLSQALNDFARETGLSVAFTQRDAVTAQSPGAQGLLTADQALTALTAGTGFTWQRSDARTVTIAQAQAVDGALALPEMRVQAGLIPSQATIGPPPPAFAGGQVGSGTQVGVLGNRGIFETPFSAQSYTEELIRNQQATVLADVLANNPSIRSARNRNAIGEAFFLRGFQLNSTDIAFDGLYGIAATRRNVLDAVERVEVLLGPSALLNGLAPFGAIGGTINLIPKRATDAPINRVTGFYASDSIIGSSVDVGRRVGQNNEFGARANFSYGGGRTGIERQTDERLVAALALDYRGERLRATANFGHDRQSGRAQPLQIRASPSIRIPSAPAGTSGLQQNWENQNAERTYVTLGVEYDLMENLGAYARYGRANNKEDSVYNDVTLLDSAGTTREALNAFRRAYETETGEAGLRARLQTGPVAHQLSVAGSFYTLTERSQFFEPGTSFLSNIYRPISVVRPLVPDFPRNPRSSERELSSFAVADTLSVLGDRIQLTVGARQQFIQIENYDRATGQRLSRYDEGALTPAVALLVKPTAALSVYGNYIEGLAQGPTAPLTSSNAGEIFAPFRSTQYEVGAKYDFGSFAATAALFRIAQPAGVLTPVTNRFSIDGEQRNQGFEMTVFGEVTERLRLLGGGTLLDGQLTRTAGGRFDGNRAPGAPRLLLNFYGEYDVGYVSGLTTTARVIYTGRQNVDQANVQSIPAWTRLDLGVRQRFQTDTAAFTARFKIENILGLDYWTAVPFAAGLQRGAPRTFLFSISADL